MRTGTLGLGGHVVPGSHLEWGRRRFGGSPGSPSAGGCSWRELGEGSEGMERSSALGMGQGPGTEQGSSLGMEQGPGMEQGSSLGMKQGPGMGQGSSLGTGSALGGSGTQPQLLP